MGDNRDDARYIGRSLRSSRVSCAMQETAGDTAIISSTISLPRSVLDSTKKMYVFNVTNISRNGDSFSYMIEYKTYMCIFFYA